MKFFIATLALATAPAAALAAQNVSLDSEVLVERVKTDAQGKRVVTLEAPKVVTPGDRLVFALSYRNGGAQPAADFVVSNPIPSAVAFDGAEGAADVSVDGGKSWGRLAALKVRQADGTFRPAVAADVTDVRWAFTQAIPAGGSGKLNFRGIVK